MRHRARAPRRSVAAPARASAPAESSAVARGPAADHVVALVDRFQQRFEMALVQGSCAVVTSTSGKSGSLEPALECLAQCRSATDRHDARVRPVVPWPRSDRPEAMITPSASVAGRSVEHDDPDARARQGIAPDVRQRGRRWCRRRHSRSWQNSRRPTAELTGQPLRQLVLQGLAEPHRDRAGAAAADLLVVDADDGQDFDRRSEQDHLIGGQQLRRASPASGQTEMPILSARRRMCCRVIPGRISCPSGVPSSGRRAPR